MNKSVETTPLGTTRSVILQEGSMPVPDPTVLTTQQLHRELAALRELIETRLNGYDKAITLLQTTMDKSPSIGEMYAKHEEMFKSIATEFLERDKALVLIHEFITQHPTVIEATVNTLRNLHDEKFNSIQKQFNERDIRTEQTQRDSKVAVDAALQAAKEAVSEQNKSSALAIGKSEASTTKQIDQLNVLIASSAKGLDDKISDMKDRLTSLDGQKTGGSAVWGYMVGAAGLITALGAVSYTHLTL